MENNGIGKLFEGVDRWTVLIYVLIVLVGFVAILSASYEEGAESIFSFSHFYMKQLVWMGISFAVAVVVLLVDASIYHKWAYLFYVLGLLTLRRPGSRSGRSVFSRWSSLKSLRRWRWPA